MDSVLSGVFVLLSLTVIYVHPAIEKRGIDPSVVYGRCPPASLLAPRCECAISIYTATVQIACHNLSDANELRRVMDEPWRHERFDWLYITNSNLTSLPARVLRGKSFVGILVTQNEIGDIDDAAFAGSDTLTSSMYMAYNKMDTFNFRSLDFLPNLQQITLMGSQITSIPKDAFVNLTSLQTVYLDENRIEEIALGAFKNLPALRRLFLENNNLTRLSNGIFYKIGSKHNVMLNLANNNIKKIEDGAFLGLSYELVDLKNNKLDILSQSSFEPLLNQMSSHSGAYLFLHGNPLKCDRRLRWLVEKAPAYKSHVRGLQCEDGRSLDVLTVQTLLKDY